MSSVHGPTVYDLFSGAGLFSSAFASEGFRLEVAIEQDALATETYRRNLDGNVILADIKSVVPQGRCDVLIAGPPCQGFSTLGKRDPEDPRNRLSLLVLDWTDATQPDVVVVENVESFLLSSTWRMLSQGLQDRNYEVTTAVVDAHDYGVPQHRARSFTFGSRLANPQMQPTGCRMTVQDAFEGLPSAPDGKNEHVFVKPTPKALERIQAVPPGGDRRDIMKARPDLVPPSWWRMGSEVTDAWGRLRWNEPSNTLRTDLHPSKGRYLHPVQDRGITVREAARLQSIPDDWTFEGPRTRQIRQLGNSVPPGLGRAVARAVAAVLS